MSANYRRCETCGRRMRLTMAWGTWVCPSCARTDYEQFKRDNAAWSERVQRALDRLRELGNGV